MLWKDRKEKSTPLRWKGQLEIFDHGWKYRKFHCLQQNFILGSHSRWVLRCDFSIAKVFINKVWLLYHVIIMLWRIWRAVPFWNNIHNRILCCRQIKLFIYTRLLFRIKFFFPYFGGKCVAEGYFFCNKISRLFLQYTQIYFNYIFVPYFFRACPLAINYLLHHDKLIEFSLWFCSWRQAHKRKFATKCLEIENTFAKQFVADFCKPHDKITQFTRCLCVSMVNLF